MRKLITLFILTAIVLGTVTISTSKVETPFDGNDTYGFPLTFFIRFSKMCKPCPANGSEIFYLKLSLDILIAFIIALIIWTGYKKVEKDFMKRQKQQPT
ncbi:MAG: hypothetical protein QM541_04705 [Flavobacterium sp.]|nr:hypothetical protein [Flavobacterium sp.]